MNMQPTARMGIPDRHPGVHYTNFLARLCSLREAKTYLEVGVSTGANLSEIAVDTAIGIDPHYQLACDPTRGKRALYLFRMSSDAFFKSKESKVHLASKIDLAFLDGLHLFEYLLRDFNHAEQNSSRDGLIALHDCLPIDGEMIERVFDFEKRSPGPNQGAWTGDVWKIVPILKEYRPDLEIVLLDCPPTGLIMISNLDPDSTVLKDRYIEIVKKWASMPNDLAAIEVFYERQQIVSSASVLVDASHTLYFRC